MQTLPMPLATLGAAPGGLDECVQLMAPLRAAWVAIGPGATAPKAQ